MIVINLVPLESRKKKKKTVLPGSRTRLPREAVVGIAGGCFLFLICVHVILQGVIFSKRIAFNTIDEQSEALAGRKSRVDQVMRELNQRRDRVQSVEAVTLTGRVLWAEKLNLISDHLPAGVWLTRVARDGDNLVIQGTAVSQISDEIISIHGFQSSLSGSEIFIKGFDHIELDMITSRLIQNVQVSDFIMIAELKPREEGS